MEENKRKLKGSPKRDLFKWYHKQLKGTLYATDADLCLVHKYPPGTVAYLDYKGSGEPVTFSEAIQYNEWMCHAPVFIIEDVCGDPKAGRFRIRRYLGGDWRPEPPTVELEFVIQTNNWAEYEQWELKLRTKYQRNRGWHKLRGCNKEAQ